MKLSKRSLLTVFSFAVAIASANVVATPASAAMTTQAPQRHGRPADLGAIYAIEDRTEAVAEGETSGNAAVVAIHDAAARWPAVRRSLLSGGAAVAQLRRMDSRVRALKAASHDPLSLRRAANDVTGALAPLFTSLGESIPADVHALDYLGRSFGLDARSAQWTDAERDSYALQTTWLHLKPIVAKRSAGANAAVAFDAAVRVCRDGAHDRNETEALHGATAVGNAVDKVEGAYK